LYAIRNPLRVKNTVIAGADRPFSASWRSPGGRKWDTWATTTEMAAR
jgi:hypothetical protein